MARPPSAGGPTAAASGGPTTGASRARSGPAGNGPSGVCGIASAMVLKTELPQNLRTCPNDGIRWRN